SGPVCRSQCGGQAVDGRGASDDAAGLRDLFIRVPRRKLRVEEYSQRGSNRRAGRPEGTRAGTRTATAFAMAREYGTLARRSVLRPSPLTRSVVTSIDFIARAAIEFPKFLWRSGFLPLRRLMCTGMASR